MHLWMKPIGLSGGEARCKTLFIEVHSDRGILVSGYQVFSNNVDMSTSNASASKATSESVTRLT